MPYIQQKQLQIYKVTQYKDGCVYKTKKVGQVWIELGTSREKYAEIAKEHGGDMLVSMSTSEPYDQWYRSLKVP